MLPRVEPLLALVERGLLRAARVVVPRAARAEWLAEWQGELAHVRAVTAARSRWQAGRERLGFCWGAWADARTLSAIERSRHRRFPRAQGSPVTCLLVLAALLAVSYGAAHLLPGVRAERALAPAPIGLALVLIQDAEDQHHGEPTIAPFEVRSWRLGNQRFFDGFAYYYLAQEQMTGAALASAEPDWRIAHATVNLLSLLAAPVRLRRPASAADAGLPVLVLSEQGWKRRFGADAHVMGQVVSLAGRRVRIAGVVPDGQWRLPGHADAWLLDPEAEHARGVLGYAVAHLTEQGQAMMRAPQVAITAYRAHSNIDSYEGIALGREVVGPWTFFLCATFLALVTLPAIAPMERAELSLHTEGLGWQRRLLRPLFFAAKLVLVWPIAYFVSLDAAYGSTLSSVTAQIYLQLVVGFLVCLFGLRWALGDQHRRCPVCLRRVAHPARVGTASSNLLAWSGTEMICTGGHTLLHIPGLPMSWFSAPRWLLREAA